MRPINMIVVHCSATKRGMTQNIGQGHEPINARVIDHWHKERNWSEIGYHFVIREDGVLETGRALNKVGAHAYGHNKYSIGICMVGGLDVNAEPAPNFAPKQFETLRSLLDTLHALLPDAEILGHRDLSPDIDGDGVIEPWEWLKACPCFDVEQWYYDGVLS